MKKIAVGILAAAIIATTTITGMAGYGKGQGSTECGNNVGCTSDKFVQQESMLTETVLSRLTANKRYVDANDDGICDNYENGTRNGGVCDGTGAGTQGNRCGQSNGRGCHGGRNR